MTFPLPEVQSAVINGGAGKVTFTAAGPRMAPSFSLPRMGRRLSGRHALEYGLVDTGFRFFATSTRLPGDDIARHPASRANLGEGPSATADLFAKMLDHLPEPESGTSQSFRCRWHSIALPRRPLFGADESRCLTGRGHATILGTEVRARAISAAVQIADKFGWAGDDLSKVLFTLLVKLRETFLTDEDTIQALIGEAGRRRSRTQHSKLFRQDAVRRRKQ
jgi:hypothetical protein